MSASGAEKLEAKLSSKPEDIPGHIRLIAFYTFAPEAPAPQKSVIGRRKHLLWMAEHEPESWLWSQRSYAAAVYVKGDRLADPDGFTAIREQWLEHLSRDPSNQKIRANAASFLALGDPETAIRLIREMRNPRYLGTEYALLLLGVTARDYDSGIPVFSDDAVCRSELAAHALAELNNSSDPDFIGGAGFWLARDGAILWSQGKLDWDYSSVAKNLLKRARELEPNRIDWLVANPELPRSGEQRPLMAVRIGGAAMKTKFSPTCRRNCEACVGPCWLISP